MHNERYPKEEMEMTAEKAENRIRETQRGRKKNELKAGEEQ